ncbi:unnamed protein product [Lactuca virosa]|uniref:G-box binding protein multifunctional mosaic region domain-containing protein n=1 Tax=Lactuca virosa TaxID=75947 RepID=A0AAU9MY60_9ASTR|nr:unnamed protein product [Lactuca virosa]
MSSSVNMFGVLVSFGFTERANELEACYGPKMTVPPYYNPVVASGHAPRPYMWGPLQHMMPPYAAFYPHGSVYAHLVVHLVSLLDLSKIIFGETEGTSEGIDGNTTEVRNLYVIS